MWNPLVGDPVIGPVLHMLGLGILFPAFFILLIVWSFAWKGLGLWYAGRNKQRYWFIAFLLIHTAGVLEIIYLKWYMKDENGKGSPTLFPFAKPWLMKAREYFSSPVPEKKAEK